MIDYLSEIRGVFSLSAISLRLYAPDKDSLFKNMPDGSEETRIENWEAFSKTKNWNEEIQSILYVSNFIHEFIHLIQYTTFLQCMHQVDFYHSITKSMLNQIQHFRKDEKNWPPSLPFLDWLKIANNEVAKEIFELWTIGNVNSQLYLGNEEFARHYCSVGGKSLRDVFIDPFNPTISNLSLEFRGYDNIPITTKMLLESQAVLLSYRFVSSFYSMNIANDWIIGAGARGRGINDSIRLDYDLLPLIALSDDMVYLMPIIIDWAFDGSAYFIDNKYSKVDYSYIHPAWRFVKLYTAAKAFKSRQNLSGSGVYHSLVNIRQVKNEIFKIAEMEVDSDDQFLALMTNFHDDIITKIFEKNVALKLKHPEAYACFESNFSLIGRETYVPITFFRDNDRQNFHSPKYNATDDVLDSARLSRFTRRAFELNRMIEGYVPKCPFCQGIEYPNPDGSIRKRYPPAGQQAYITREMLVSEQCGCMWAYEFKDFWGVTPEEFHKS